jgi:ABC-type enterobactin transport system permease subunit
MLFKLEASMNSKRFLMVVVVIAAFGIAVAAIGPVIMATPVVAQNVTGDNATTAGNVTAAGNTTGGSWTK